MQCGSMTWCFGVELVIYSEFKNAIHICMASVIKWFYFLERGIFSKWYETNRNVNITFLRMWYLKKKKKTDLTYSLLDSLICHWPTYASSSVCLDWSCAVNVSEWHVFVPVWCLWLVCVCLDHPWVIRFLVFLLTWAVSCVSLLSAVLSFPSTVLFSSPQNFGCLSEHSSLYMCAHV